MGSQIKGGTKKSTGVQPTSGDSSTLADPILFAAAFKRNRFYVFSKREPDDGKVVSGGSSTFFCHWCIVSL